MRKRKRHTKSTVHPAPLDTLSYRLLCLGRRANQVANMTFHPKRVDLTQFAEPAIHRSPSFGDDSHVVVRLSQRDLVLA
jgi:hypothetical protein